MALFALMNNDPGMAENDDYEEALRSFVYYEEYLKQQLPNVETHGSETFDEYIERSNLFEDELYVNGLAEIDINRRIALIDYKRAQNADDNDLSETAELYFRKSLDTFIILSGTDPHPLPQDIYYSMNAAFNIADLSLKSGNYAVFHAYSALCLEYAAQLFDPSLPLGLRVDGWQSLSPIASYIYGAAEHRQDSILQRQVTKFVKKHQVDIQDWPPEMSIYHDLFIKSPIAISMIDGTPFILDTAHTDEVEEACDQLLALAKELGPITNEAGYVGLAAQQRIAQCYKSIGTLKKLINNFVESGGYFYLAGSEYDKIGYDSRSANCKSDCLEVLKKGELKLGKEPELTSQSYKSFAKYFNQGLADSRSVLDLLEFLGVIEIHKDLDRFEATVRYFGSVGIKLLDTSFTDFPHIPTLGQPPLFMNGKVGKLYGPQGTVFQTTPN